MENDNHPILWYFADPMCSWCWGFSPVISEIRDHYNDRLKIALVMGGLRSNDSPMTTKDRKEILHHWREVEKLTGQDFSFENALPAGFVYNTEPACRAVICAGQLDEDSLFAYFTAVQRAFYSQNRDVTRKSVLQQLAVENGLDGEAFARLFDDEKMAQATQKSFAFTQKAGVRGFPTLILAQNQQLQVLGRGYMDFAELRRAITAHLSP